MYITIFKVLVSILLVQYYNYIQSFKARIMEPIKQPFLTSGRGKRG